MVEGGGVSEELDSTGPELGGAGCDRRRADPMGQ
jgi:hypothetical protein